MGPECGCSGIPGILAEMMMSFSYLSDTRLIIFSIKNKKIISTAKSIMTNGARRIVGWTFIFQLKAASATTWNNADIAKNAQNHAELRKSHLIRATRAIDANEKPATAPLSGCEK